MSFFSDIKNYTHDIFSAASNHVPVASIACLAVFAPTLIYIPNNGGSSYDLPLNLMTAGLLALFVTGILLTRKFRLATLLDDNDMTHAQLFMLFCIALAVLLQESDHALISGVFRFLNLGFIFILWLVLNQVPQLRNQQITLLTGIVLFAVLQSVLSILQITFPSLLHSMLEFKFEPSAIRPYGIFQQVNVLASFLATGLICSVWLWIKNDKNFPLIISMSALVISVALFLTQSRTGMLGFLLALSIILIISAPQVRIKLIKIIFVIVLGAVIASIVRYQISLGTREYTGSNVARFELWLHSVEMIMAKPFSGWGFGSFEHDFARIRMDAHAYKNSFDVVHPHNEILYYWIEGGVLAFTGLMAILISWFLPLWKLRNNVERQLLWSLTLPVVLHTMLEFPLYQSLPHLWLLLLLGHLALRSSEDDATLSACKEKRRHFSLRLTLAILTLGVSVFFFSGLQTNALLTQAERGQFLSYPSRDQLWNPWIQGERYEFGEMVHCLMRYNQTRDERLLARFVQQSSLWLERHNDLNVFRNAVMIEWHLRHYQRSRRLLRQALTLYPTDESLLQLKAKMMTEWSSAAYAVTDETGNF